MALPTPRYLDAHIVKELSDLQGRAKVTFPYDDLSYPRVERVEKRNLKQSTNGLFLPYLQVDQEYNGTAGKPSTVLTTQQRLSGGDDQKAPIYFAWEVLPGKWIYDTRYDDNLGPVQVRRRLVLFDAANIGVENATGKTTYGARDQSTLVSWETQEAWSDGTGSTGNPVYPITTAPLYYDEAKGAVKETSQTVNPTGSEAGSITFTPDSMGSHNGTITETSYEPQGAFLLKKTVKTWHVAAPVRTTYVYDSETDVTVTETRQLVELNAPDPSITNLFTDFRSEITNGAYKQFVTRVYPSGITSVTWTESEEDRYVYPAIMTGVTFQSLTQYKDDPDNPGSFLVARILRQSYNVIEAERPRTVSHLVSVSFSTTAPTAASILTGLTQINPVRNTYNGFLFNVITGPVLQDSASYFINTGGSDPEWPNGGVIETYAAPASSPTATAYLALRAAGSYITVHKPSKKIAHSLWKLMTVSIPAL